MHVSGGLCEFKKLLSCLSSSASVVYYWTFLFLTLLLLNLVLLSLSSVKSVTDPPNWHQPGSPERQRVPRESILSSSPTHTSSTPFHQQGYVREHTHTHCLVTDLQHLKHPLDCVCVYVQAKLMSECSGSIDSVKRVKLILNDEEEELDDVGLTSSTADKQTSTGTVTEIMQEWEVSHRLSFWKMNQQRNEAFKVLYNNNRIGFTQSEQKSYLFHYALFGTFTDIHSYTRSYRHRSETRSRFDVSLS